MKMWIEIHAFDALHAYFDSTPNERSILRGRASGMKFIKGQNHKPKVVSSQTLS